MARPGAAWQGKVAALRGGLFPRSTIPRMDERLQRGLAILADIDQQIAELANIMRGPSDRQTKRTAGRIRRMLRKARRTIEGLLTAEQNNPPATH